MRSVVFLVFFHSFPLQCNDGWELREVFEHIWVRVRVFPPRKLTFFDSLFELFPGGILPVRVRDQHNVVHDRKKDVCDGGHL